MKYLKLFAFIFALVILGGCGETDSLSGGGATTDPTTDPGTDPTTDPTDPTTDPVPTTPTGVAGSISFVSASPSTISIKGTGGTETSTVTFRVLDTGGFGLANQSVAFSLNSTVGGITLSPATGVSDASGYVTTAVSSGTVSTVASVTATLQAEPAISTTSTGPVVSTGVADQNSFSFSTEFLNPEAWGYDGEPVTLTIHAADHFNNPVPDGDVVYFQTEGGQIDPSCQLVGGSCSVQWRSANPRPSDGRATITATMRGEESFSDSNGNGLLDDSETYTDLPEAFYDYNENGTFDPSNALMDRENSVYYEEPRDFNGNGLYDSADGEYNGVLCNPDNQAIVCSSSKKLDVRAKLVFIMSGSFVENATSSALLPLNGSSGTASTTITLADINNQVMPYDTAVQVTAKDGLTLLTDSSFTIPSSNAPGGTSHFISVKVNDPSTPGESIVTVKVTTPNNNTTNLTIPVTW